MIDTRRLEDKAYEYLLNQIIEGNIQYGQIIDIKEIAARLNTSVTPVREAIKRLQFEQIVDFKPRANCQVKVPNKKRVQEIYDIRELLETYALTTSIEKIDPEKLNHLRSLVEQMRNIESENFPASKKKIVELDRLFHTEICALAGNEYLNSIYRLLSLHVNMAFIHDKVYDPIKYHESHARIIQALANNEEEAIRALRRHFQEVKERLSKVIEDDAL